jgi:S1-C subfamily serine protease
VTAQTRTSKKQWYYELQGRAVGPVPESDLKLLAENGTLKPDARVWSDGMIEWEPAVAVVPRAFAEVETGGGWNFQHVVALILATAAVASVAILGVVAYQTNKGTEPEKKPVEVVSKPDEIVPKKDEPVGKTDKPVVPVNPITPKAVDPPNLFKLAAPSMAVIRSKSSGEQVGSGFVVDRDLVVTTAQVLCLELSDTIEVTFAGGTSPQERVAATVAYEDRARDLAILRVGSAPPALRLVAGGNPGDRVLVFGGSAVTPTTLGGREVVRGVPYHALDSAAVGQKQTGSPVFNAKGEVVGVVAAYPDATGTQWRAYAIPAADVTAAVQKAGGIGDASRSHDAGVIAARQLAVCIIANAQIRAYTEAVKQGQAATVPLAPLQSIKRVQEKDLADLRLVLKGALPDPVRKATEIVIVPSVRAVEGRELLVELNKTVGTLQDLVEDPLKDRNLGNFKDAHRTAWERVNALCPRLFADVGMAERPDGVLSEPVRLTPLALALGIPEDDLLLSVRRVLREVEFEKFAARHGLKK